MDFFEDLYIYILIFACIFMLIAGFVIGYLALRARIVSNIEMIHNLQIDHLKSDLAKTKANNDNIISNITHEIMTPLASIVGTVDNVIDGVQEWDVDTGEKIIAHCERIQELSSFFLSLAKTSNDATRLNICAVNVLEWITETVSEIDITSMEKVVKFNIEITPDDLTGNFDKNRMTQVLINLVNNAIRHAKANSTISIRAFNVQSIADEKDRLRLLVFNYGKRLSDDDSVIFTRFTSGVASGLDKTSAKASKTKQSISSDVITGGTGVGLSIAKWIVDLHGGSIRIAHPEDFGFSENGTLFLVELPS